MNFEKRGFEVVSLVKVFPPLERGNIQLRKESQERGLKKIKMFTLAAVNFKARAMAFIIDP